MRRVVGNDTLGDINQEMDVSMWTNASSGREIAKRPDYKVPLSTRVRCRRIIFSGAGRHDRTSRKSSPLPRRPARNVSQVLTVQCPFQQLTSSFALPLAWPATSLALPLASPATFDASPSALLAFKPTVFLAACAACSIASC